ncbi:MAG: adenylate/guanylate cyclase domain-containing protein [Rubrivivax sp.]
MRGRLRSVSACILLAYVVAHLLNHALALGSLAAADALLALLSRVWRSWPATVVLAGAFVVHFGVALHAIWRRRTFRMSRWEWAQLLLGLSIVPLGLTHVISTRVAHEVHEVYTNHFWVLWSMAMDPWQLARQFGLVLAVWAHACIGLHFWWRVKPWYPRALPVLYAVALLLPALALAGAGVGLGHVLAVMEDPLRLRAALAETRPPSRQEVADLYLLSDLLKLLALGLVCATLLARQVRMWWLRRRATLRIAYPGERSVEFPAGISLLEASRMCRLPHASVCGGRGRCSTCRVRVGGPAASLLPPPGPDEARVLARLGSPPHVRLACQVQPPAGDYVVTRLLPASAQPADAYSGHELAVGSERSIAVMFVDLRGFTAFSEKRLPYDVVFILNRYFRSVGLAVEGAGGRVDKFIGDGVMALFGLECEPARAAVQALMAARGIAGALAELNELLASELQEPLRVGIGLHAGTAIVGELGHGQATSLTAIGDTVNTASRLEALSKELGAQLVVSRELLQHAGLTGLAGALHEVQVRGREQPLEVHAVGDVLADIPADFAVRFLR